MGTTAEEFGLGVDPLKVTYSGPCVVLNLEEFGLGCWSPESTGARL